MPSKFMILHLKPTIMLKEYDFKLLHVLDQTDLRKLNTLQQVSRKPADP